MAKERCLGWFTTIATDAVMIHTKLVVGTVLILKAFRQTALPVLAYSLLAQSTAVIVRLAVFAFRVRIFAFSVARLLAVVWFATIVYMIMAFVRFPIGFTFAWFFTFFALSIIANTVVKTSTISVDLTGGTLGVHIFAATALARAIVRAVPVRFAVVTEVFFAIVLARTFDTVAIFANFVVCTMGMLTALALFAFSILADTVLDRGTVGIVRAGRAGRVNPRTSARAAGFTFQGFSSDCSSIVAFKGRFGSSTIALRTLEDFPFALVIVICNAFVGKTSLGTIGAMNRRAIVGQWSTIARGASTVTVAVPLVRNVQGASSTGDAFQRLTFRLAQIVDSRHWSTILQLQDYRTLRTVAAELSLIPIIRFIELFMITIIQFIELF